MNFPILSSLILLPTIGALFIFFTRSNKKENITVKYVALFTSFVNFFLSVYLWILFDQSTSEFQFVENRIWIKDFINYKVGIDDNTNIGVKTKNQNGGCSILNGFKKKIESFQKLFIVP